MKFIALLAALPIFWVATATAQTPPAKVTAHSTATSTTVQTKKGLLGETSTVTKAKAKGTATAVIPGTPAPKAAPLPAPAPKAQPAPEKPKPAVRRSTGRERVLVGNPTPAAVAAMITRSLQIDGKGNQPIDPAHCSLNQDGCGTPNDLLALFQKADPKYGLTSVQQLPEYVGQLDLTTLPERLQGVKVWMGCLKATGPGKHRAIWNCLSREFHKGEKVYMSRKTGVIVNPGDCWNGVGEPDVKEVALDCNEIVFWMNRGDEVHIGWLSTVALPDDKCNALMKAGEDEWSYLLLDECPRDRCDFSRPSRYLGLPVQAKPRISFKAETSGWQRLRLTTQVGKLDNSAFVLCLIWPDGYQSLGKDIHRNAYGRTGRAYIAYPDGPKKSRDQVIPSGWQETVHMWRESGERIMPE